jgi:hypothetical protein
VYCTEARQVFWLPAEYKLNDLEFGEGRRGLPERETSGKKRDPIRVLEGSWWRREREMGEIATSRRL